jgi:dTMP kinase
MKRGRFIVIDGIDGSGKSSQVRMLKKKFSSRAVFTHDPGGTDTGQAVREVVLVAKPLSPLSVFFLFLAARAALVEEVIAPALAKGRTVVSDRFDSSTYAYQVHAGKHSEYRKLMSDFTRDVLKESTPDAYIILDSDPMLARQRLFHDRAKDLNAYDKKPLSYHRSVREGFKKFKPKGAKVFFVNADRSLAEVHEDVWRIVSRILK